MDVICISWTCSDKLTNADKSRLEKKIIQDAGRDSVVFCATGDKGPSTKQKSYPAGFASPFEICNCSIAGDPSANAEPQHSDFILPAENLLVDVPKYLNKDGNEMASGSSAATAVAAGLVALILTLASFAFYPEEQRSSDADGDWPKPDMRSKRFESEVQGKLDHLKLRSTMEKVLKFLCDGSEKFVQPWRVLPLDLEYEEFSSAKRRIAEFLDAASN